ncbi:hypothetical protein [Methylobacterium iners]|uniref:Uncharacterized protein n=1 Tax=Methylobacterium iners TaxID=418707 RepID=A0ABQ4S4V7_9HYPH|nr:hypothetical protein [Methylobacterium iners]GJD97432.1 hypothetical protein OCOJLMKI_4663 [Methylobacterium iners]
MRLAALAIAVAVLVPGGAGAKPGDRVEFTQAEYVAAYRKAVALKPAPGREPFCRRRLGARAAGVLTQACLDGAGGSHARCQPQGRETCAGIVERLDWLCRSRAVEGIPCTYPKPTP